MPDLTTAERFAFAPVIALMLVLGFYPQLIAGKMTGTVAQWTTPAISSVQTAINTVTNPSGYPARATEAHR